jgi:3-isopropylmalate dehydrogenase
MFGDILTDEASVLGGSMGNLPSASIGEIKNSLGFSLGLYEPIHGSAPDIAGQGIANPVGTILSAALLLEYSLGLKREARLLETAVRDTLMAGIATPDLAADSGTSVTTSGMVEAVVQRIKA